MDESEGNSSMDSIEVGPSSPRRLVTPRIPALIRESPLSTKREKLKKTPMSQKLMPKVVKTAPPMRSLYSAIKPVAPVLITQDGTKPLVSPFFDRRKADLFLDQAFSSVTPMGKGSFGEVFSAQSREDSRYYAVKVSINTLRHNSSSKYREVLNHMSLPPHYNLVRFERAWEEQHRLFIQTELCMMSLLEYCTKKHNLPESQIWGIFIDLLRAVDHLHSNEMIHDDIKPENIFLTKDFVCKLGDFGLAVNLKNPHEVQSAEEGDSKYLAPEVLNGKPTKSSDIFSLGMTILEVATDLFVPSNGTCWHLIRNGEIPERFFKGVSKDLRSLIEQMLSHEASERPTTKELLEHPAIKSRLFGRQLVIKHFIVREIFSYYLFVLLSWAMAFFAVIFQHPIAMFQAVSRRRSAIFAEMSGQKQKQQQQRTPIQTPEGARAFSESFNDNVFRNQTAPFDFSDDENSPHYQRRLFPIAPLVSRFSLDDDDDEDDEQATSSSNSSAIDTTSSPGRSLVRSPNKFMAERQGTPKSARKIFPSSLSARGATLYASSPSTSAPQQHGGSGDGFSAEERAAWLQAKYERMMKMEARLDSDDNDNDIVDETPLVQMPFSCPSFPARQGRRLTVAPKLNFNLLDEDEKQQPSTSSAAPSGALNEETAARRRMARSRMISFQGSSGDEV